MSTPILTTKLYVPPPRPNLVHRPRLIEQLNEGLHRKMTLISASAGFGKTTLVGEWVAGCEQPTAWLSLDKEDNDPDRFLTYLIASLQTIAPEMGEGALSLLQSSQSSPTKSILTVLLNEIATIPDNFILVLDDYHLLDAKAIDDALTFLLEHLPPQMHLVFASREDPLLPLARYRVRGQMTELRATDLRFTPDEAAGFLNAVMGLELSAEEISSLETRTEGWIAGLQMAALSMQGRADTTGFIQAFTGSHRFVLDYLVDEVLLYQSEVVRNFLLQTSILDRLSGSLCDAVTRQEDSRGLLETLERGNLFVVPLDDQRQWYRYHHLFADVLQTYSMTEQSEQIVTLHQRASQWYEQNGFLSDGIRHALAAEDFERAAGLIEQIWPTMDGSFQSATWLGWVEVLPDELVRARPVLSVAYAWALLNGGKMEASEARLRDAERWLETTEEMGEQPKALLTEMANREMVVVDKEQFRSLPSSIATARAYRALAFGDISGTVNHAQKALDLLYKEEHRWRDAATSLLGLAQYASGDLEAAERSLADFMASVQQAGKITDAISITFILADIRLTLGRLREAMRTYEQSLQLALSPTTFADTPTPVQGKPPLLGTADLYRGISELHREQGDLERATQELLLSEKLGEQAALTDWHYRLCVAQARLKETQGDLDGACDLLDEAERLHVRNPLPDVRPIAALRTRVWVKQGKLVEAQAWVRERGLSTNDDLSYLLEFEHITLARVLIAQDKSHQRDASREDGTIREAVGLLERLLSAAAEGGRKGSVIEILVLHALAFEAQSDTSKALLALKRALTLAEPEGYVRIFADEGPLIGALLQEIAKQGIAPNYVRQRLVALGQARDRTPVTQPLIEPLSERELDVLQLLRTELTGPEIARELSVSLNTMRTHTKNIYSKLGVNNRRTAVRRGEELDLL